MGIGKRVQARELKEPASEYPMRPLSTFGLGNGRQAGRPLGFIAVLTLDGKWLPWLLRLKGV